MKRTMLTIVLCGLIFGNMTVGASLSTQPADRLNQGWWKNRHEQKLEALKHGSYDMVFIGDSITQLWDGRGKELWNKWYVPRNALNLGFSGDRTEHVLWRLDHGELEGLSPRLIVLMIGTNNTGHRMDPPEEIADGIKQICRELRTRMPDTHILLLAIFPRGATPADPKRINNEKVNNLIATLGKDDHITYANINEALLDKDGTLSRSVMPDLLHPNNKGLEIWAKAMEPYVIKILGQRPTATTP